MFDIMLTCGTKQHDSFEPRHMDHLSTRLKKSKGSAVRAQ